MVADKLDEHLIFEAQDRLDLFGDPRAHHLEVDLGCIDALVKVAGVFGRLEQRILLVFEADVVAAGHPPETVHHDRWRTTCDGLRSHAHHVFLRMPGVNSIKLLTGNSHPELAQLVSKRCVVCMLTQTRRPAYRVHLPQVC